MEKSIKFLSMFLMALLLSLPMVSCSDDDDDSGDAKGDFYLIATSVSGGGFSDQQCTTFLNKINNDYELAGYYWGGVTKGDAIYYADKDVKSIAEALSKYTNLFEIGNGSEVKIVIELKTNTGSQVKKYTIILKKDAYEVK